MKSFLSALGVALVLVGLSSYAVTPETAATAEQPTIDNNDSAAAHGPTSSALPPASTAQRCDNPGEKQQANTVPCSGGSCEKPQCPTGTCPWVKEPKKADDAPACTSCDDQPRERRQPVRRLFSRLRRR